MSTRLLTLVTFSPALMNGQRKKGVREGRREGRGGEEKEEGPLPLERPVALPTSLILTH